jgi:hypothetical protein
MAQAQRKVVAEEKPEPRLVPATPIKHPAPVAGIKHPGAPAKDVPQTQDDKDMQAARELHPINPSTVEVDGNTIAAGANPAFDRRKVKNAENQEFVKADGVV